MKQLYLNLIIVSLLLASIVSALFTLPTTFTLNPNMNNLPTPQPNQKLFGCPYELPITFRNINATLYSQQGNTITVNATFSLYANGQRSACSVPYTLITCNAGNWQNCLEDYITTESVNNING